MGRTVMPPTQLSRSVVKQTRGFPVMRGDEFGKHLGLNDSKGNPIGGGSFSSGGGPVSPGGAGLGYSKKYAENYERVFGKKVKGASAKESSDEATGKQVSEK